jgi:hypothetical protein
MRGTSKNQAPSGSGFELPGNSQSSPQRTRPRRRMTERFVLAIAVLAALAVVPTAFSRQEPTTCRVFAIRTSRRVGSKWREGQLSSVADSVYYKLYMMQDTTFRGATPGNKGLLKGWPNTYYLDIGTSGFHSVADRIFIHHQALEPASSALCRISIKGGRVQPRRVLYRMPPPMPKGLEYPLEYVDSLTVPRDSIASRGLEWVTFTEDTMNVQIQLNPRALSQRVWLPHARRWTNGPEETVQCTIAAAIYWIREAHCGRAVPENPTPSQNRQAWEFAEALSSTPVPE